MITSPIRVEPGAEIRPAFQAAKAAAQALQPRPGHGSYLSLTPFGYSVSARSKSNSFRHPWQPSLIHGKVPTIRLSRGLVEGRTPVIKVGGSYVPMTGDGKKPAPELKLNHDDIDAKRGESWVCVEVRPDGDGKIAEDEHVEIVHRAEPTTGGEVGRQPLVLIVWDERRPGALFQVTYFNLRYAYRDIDGGRRHYFL